MGRGGRAVALAHGRVQLPGTVRVATPQGRGQGQTGHGRAPLPGAVGRRLLHP